MQDKEVMVGAIGIAQNLDKGNNWHENWQSLALCEATEGDVIAQDLYKTLMSAIL